MKFFATYFSFLLLFPVFNGFSQHGLEKETNRILKEGYMLYKLEQASWQASSIQKNRYHDLNDSLGGFLSYISNDKIRTIFWNENDSFHIQLELNFDSIAGEASATSIELKREADHYEKELIQLRQAAFHDVLEDSEEFYELFEGISLNLIPVIENGRKGVFIITGPRSDDEILFGNDYLLRFNSRNQLKSRVKLHESLVTIPFNENTGTNNNRTTFHSHASKKTQLISSTDICTLLLYRNYIHWKYHMVTSKRFVSVWNVETGTLMIFKRKDYMKSFIKQNAD